MADELRHFCDLESINTDVLRRMLMTAEEWKKNPPADPCQGQTLAMIFAQPSTRTRLSFTLAMQMLGGRVLILDHRDSQLGRGETFADTARLLSRYVDVVTLRTDCHGNLDEMVEHSSIPMINALTDISHPCQVMADVMTFEQKRGSIQGHVLAWIGDGNNMTHSWAQAALRFGFTLRIATPPSCALPQQRIETLRSQGADIRCFTDPDEAATGASAIVTDTWTSMGIDDAQARRKRQDLKGYQVNAARMARGKDAIFMHCLPAHRGEEVTAEVMDGAASVVWDEAENRLHVQKAILAWCLHVI